METKEKSVTESNFLYVTFQNYVGAFAQIRYYWNMVERLKLYCSSYACKRIISLFWKQKKLRTCRKVAMQNIIRPSCCNLTFD